MKVVGDQPLEQRALVTLAVGGFREFVENVLEGGDHRSFVFLVWYGSSSLHFRFMLLALQPVHGAIPPPLFELAHRHARPRLLRCKKVNPAQPKVAFVFFRKAIIECSPLFQQTIHIDQLDMNPALPGLTHGVAGKAGG